MKGDYQDCPRVEDLTRNRFRLQRGQAAIIIRVAKRDYRYMPWWVEGRVHRALAQARGDDE